MIAVSLEMSDEPLFIAEGDIRLYRIVYLPLECLNL